MIPTVYVKSAMNKKNFIVENCESEACVKTKNTNDLYV